MMKKPTTIDAYLSGLPKEQKRALQTLRKQIKEIAPEADEKIAWGMPTFWYYGNLVHFAAFKNHMSLFPSRRITTTERSELAKRGIKVSGASAIQFTADKSLTATFIKKLIKARMKENTARK